MKREVIIPKELKENISPSNQNLEGVKGWLLFLTILFILSGIQYTIQLASLPFSSYVEDFYHDNYPQAQVPIIEISPFFKIAQITILIIFVLLIWLSVYLIFKKKMIGK